MGNAHRIRKFVQILLLLFVAITGVVVGVIEKAHATESHLPFLPPVENLTLILVGLLAFELFLEYMEIQERLAKVEATETERKITELPMQHRMIVRDTTGAYVKLYHLNTRLRRTNPAFTRLTDDILKEQTSGLKTLAAGKLSIPPDSVGLYQRRLLQYYHESFEAVSYEDLFFWLSDEESGEYYQAALDARERYSMSISRVFVVPRTQFLADPGDVLKVLEKQFADGVGWGLALSHDLSLDLKGPNQRLDFALLDDAKVVTTFRQTNPRRFEAIFCTPDTEKDTAAQRDVFAQFVAGCWLVTPPFLERYPAKLPPDSKHVQHQLRRRRDILSKVPGLTPDPAAAPFPMIATMVEEIGPKLEILSRVIKKNR